MRLPCPSQQGETEPHVSCPVLSSRHALTSLEIVCSRIFLSLFFPSVLLLLPTLLTLYTFEGLVVFFGAAPGLRGGIHPQWDRFACASRSRHGRWGCHRAGCSGLKRCSSVFCIMHCVQARFGFDHSVSYSDHEMRFYGSR